MIKKSIFILLLVVSSVSCEKSKEEIAQEKAAKVTQEKIHKEKINIGKQKKTAYINEKLQELIEYESMILNVIESMKDGSSSSKNNRLEQANEILNSVRIKKEKLKNELTQLQYVKTFEFQKSPEKVMTYIFEAFKKGDFSNFRYLCDPYGEYQFDIDKICYIEIHSVEEKNRFKEEFENAKVIGRPEFDQDKAEVKYTYGKNSEKQDVMLLVQRNEHWYLIGNKLSILYKDNHQSL